MDNENKTHINWVSRIYGKLSIITCKIKKIKKSFYTFLIIL